MTCANCGQFAVEMEHRFYEGLAPDGRSHGEKPKREWTIIAPLYFKSNEDYTAVIEGYCSPICALARMGSA